MYNQGKYKGRMLSFYLSQKHSDRWNGHGLLELNELTFLVMALRRFMLSKSQTQNRCFLSNELSAHE